MDSSRIKSIRAGNRAAVTKFFKKLDELNTDSEMDIDIAVPIIDAIVKKHSVILKGIRYSRDPSLIFSKNFDSRSILMCTFQIWKEKSTFITYFLR